jgi:hypothetical protein
MSAMTRVGTLVVAVLVCLGSAVVLYTYDVHVPITGNGPPKDSFCGSAYDVVFLKKDGYMGGEIPPNQDRIDHRASAGPGSSSRLRSARAFSACSCCSRSASASARAVASPRHATTVRRPR